MPIFTSQSGNDAHASIRGYVYQIDRTILNWLELQPNQALELERGEDIDIVWKNPSDNADEIARVSQQIKNYENKRINLRDTSVLDALVSFFEHQCNNPSYESLRFCFVTTASAGRERSVRHAPLIKYWERIQSAELADKEKLEITDNIKAFFLSLKKTRVKKPRWQVRWQTFIQFLQTADSQRLHSFMGKVEWATRQPDAGEIEAVIKKRLAADYEIPDEQLEEFYRRLFFRVTKRLTQSGLKQLTVAERNETLDAATLHESERVQVNQLRSYVLLLNDRVTNLEIEVDYLKRNQIALPTPLEIKKACASHTERITQSLTKGRTLIHRESLSKHFDRFISSETRCCLLLGVTDMGKSMLMATEAKRLLASGCTVLLLRGNEFSQSKAATIIGAGLSRISNPFAWQQVIDTIQEDSGATAIPFVLMVDALDEADHQSIYSSLREIIDSFGATDPRKFKLVISCKQIFWESLSDVRFLLEQERAADRLAFVTSVTISEFSTEELDTALNALGALELIPAVTPSQKLDSHTAALHSLLRHPAAFGNFAELRKSNHAFPSGEEITWSTLIKKRLDDLLGKAGAKCGYQKEALQPMLQRIAQRAFEHSARDFTLAKPIVKKDVPQLFKAKNKSSETPLQALAQSDLLQLTEEQGELKQIGFRDNDVAAYLLSFDLECQIAKQADDQLRDWLTEISGRAWNFPALGDALLALFDRLLTAKPRPARLRKLVKALLENHDYRRGSFINLLNPRVLQLIFELYQRNEIEPDFFCFDAAMSVRSSPEAAAIARQHLSSYDEKVQRLAIQLVKNYEDPEAIDPLIQILLEPDSSNSEAIFSAFGQLGKPVLPKILPFLGDVSKATSQRKLGLYALRGIGISDKNTVAALHACLADESEPEFLAEVLLTAVSLGDDSHNEKARQLLCHSNLRLVHASAKYFTDFPLPSVFSDLQSALSAQAADGTNNLYHYLLPKQLVAALLKTNRDKALSIITPLLLDGLNSVGRFTRFECLQIIEKHHLKEMIPSVFMLALTELQQSLATNQAWRITENLRKVWQPEEIPWLTKAAKQAKKDGTDSAKLYVDAIAANIHHSSEFPIGDSLNRVEDLTTLVKAQVPNVLTESRRLLPLTHYSSLMELCEWWWVAEDTRAESVLLARLNEAGNPSTQGQRDGLRLEREAIISALGTCGGKQGAAAVIAYLRKEPSLPYGLIDRAIVPLLLRQQISPTQLTNIINEPSASLGGRILSFLALNRIDYDVDDENWLYQLAEDSSVDELQYHAVEALGAMQTATARQWLLKLFHSQQTNPSLRATAGLALSRNESPQFVCEIEAEFHENSHRYLLSALKKYRQASSVPLIVEGLTSSDYMRRNEFLQALGPFVNCAEGRQAIERELNKWDETNTPYIDSQSPLILGLLPFEPDLALEHFLRAYDNKVAHVGACETVAIQLRLLLKKRQVDQTLLQVVSSRLLCHLNVKVREYSAQSLTYASKEFQQAVLAKLMGTSNSEWQRACGVYAMAFCDCESAEILAARRDQESLVRKTVSESIAVRERRVGLQSCIKRFTSTKGIARLSAYLCLEEQGVASTIWQLYETVQPKTVEYAFLNQLEYKINRRLENEYGEKQRKQESLSDQRGSIPLD